MFRICISAILSTNTFIALEDLYIDPSTLLTIPMCEGDPPTPNRRRRAPRRRSRHTPTQHGVERAPPLASIVDGRWQARECQWQTPEYCSTLQVTGATWSTAAPLLTNHFLVVATTDGRLCVVKTARLLTPPEVSETMDNDASNAVPIHTTSMILEAYESAALKPDYIVNAGGDDHDLIVHVVEADGAEQDENPTIASLTDMGHVTIWKLLDQQAELVKQFETELPAATCLAVNVQRVVVGYATGVIECWSVEDETLQMRAAFDVGCRIRSVCSLQPDKDSVIQEDQPDGAKDASKDYLLLTIEPEERVATPSLIEMIDLTALLQSWNAETQETVAMEPRCIMPEEGMQIMDAATLEQQYRQQLGTEDPDLPLPNWIPGPGTGNLLSRGGRMFASLADGMVGMITSRVEGGRLIWGIADDSQQLLLAYPSVGLGRISNVDGSDGMVACLRGGTIYIIPCNSESAQPIKVLAYPHDIDTDSSVQLVQGFTAGNALYRPSGLGLGHEMSVPILVYTWPGGIMEVFAAGLLPKEKPGMRIILGQLLENGSVDLLRKILRQEGPEVRTEWQPAAQELEAFAQAEGDEFVLAITLEDLCSQKLSSFSSLLLDFAKV